jgi:hypothetical protein
MTNYISSHAKAFVAALVAGLTSVQVALDGTAPISKEQWITLGIGAVIGLLGVAAVPNATPATPATFTLPNQVTAPAAPVDPVEPPAAV